MKKSTYWLLIFIFSLLLLPKTTMALGQMTEPIVINNALRGESIQQELIAVNSENVDVNVIFIAEGAVQNWTKFYLAKDLVNPIAETVVPASGNLRVIAIIKVPMDIENGQYEGILSVKNIPKNDIEKTETGSNVVQKIDRQVLVTISDKELIDIKNTSVIPNKFDIDVNEPLSIRVIFDNEGNIRLSPQIRIKIKKDDKTVHDLIYPYPEGKEAVNSKSQLEIEPIIIQTLGWEEGKYNVSLDFNRGDEVILKKDFNFSIKATNAENKDTKTVSGNALKSYLGIGLFVALLIVIIIWQAVKKNKK